MCVSVCSCMCMWLEMEEVPARCWGSNRWETDIWTAGIHCLSQTLYTNHLSSISPFCHSCLSTLSFLFFSILFTALSLAGRSKITKVIKKELICAWDFVYKQSGEWAERSKKGTFYGGLSLVQKQVKVLDSSTQVHVFVSVRVCVSVHVI